MVLEYGKLERYPCPLLPNLVREGNLGRDNPNHFWNALFSPFRDYRDRTFKEKMAFIRTERERIGNAIGMDEWLVYADGIHTNQAILQLFRSSFMTFESNDVLMSMVMQLVGGRETFMNEMEQGIPLNRTHVECRTWVCHRMTKLLLQRLEEMEKKEGRHMPMDKKDKCVARFGKTMSDLWDTCVRAVYTKFVEDLKDSETSIASFFLPLILGHIDYHVFFVDARGKHVLRMNDHYERILRDRPKDECVLLLYDTKTHLFECLGVMMEMSDDDESVCVCRVFDTDEDPIAEICYKNVLETE